MSSGLIPLEDFEHAIAHLSLVPTLPIHPPANAGKLKRRHQSEVKEERQPQNPNESGPTLPLEIVQLIGRHLFQGSHQPFPSWILKLESPCMDDADTRYARVDFRALLQLSAACKAFRSLLAPLTWHAVYFHHPRHFGEFVELMKRYRSISGPLCMLPGLTATASHSYEWKQEYPLRLVKELHLVMPQKYPGFQQGLLVTLLRDGMNQGLRHVVWESEELPAASTLKAMQAEDYYSTSPSQTFTPLQDIQPKYSLASEIEEEDIVQWTRASRDGEAFPAKGVFLPSRKEAAPATSAPSRNGLLSLSINCKCFWPGHATLQYFSSLQHIQLTYYDLFLLPPHLPALLQNLQSPLHSLSMSTSKTSLFHSIPLINSGCFDHLHLLDLYPVTPEYPLPQAIRRSRKKLRVLRLVMDISANFTNFDNLWKILAGSGEDQKEGQDEDMSGPMEALEVLHIDPMPQQNTAPSFVHFVETCPRLQWVNGRKKDKFAPGMEPINPDEITSALYY